MIKSLCKIATISTALACSACASAPQPVIEEVVDVTPDKKHVSRGEFPFQGEVMTFEAHHVGLKATVAEAQITVGHESTLEDGTRYIPIIGTANTKGLANFIVRVNDRAEAYLNPDTWETIYSYKHLNEGQRDREYNVWFWPDDQIASVERHQGERTVKRDYLIPNNSMDSIAWIFIVRTMNLEQGKSYTQFTYDGWTINKVELKVVGEEDVWTENGFIHCQKYEIWRERSDAIEPMGALSGIYIDPPRKLHTASYQLATAWLATDSIKTPVRLMINTGIGEFDLLIKSYMKQ